MPTELKKCICYNNKENKELTISESDVVRRGFFHN